MTVEQTTCSEEPDLSTNYTLPRTRAGDLRYATSALFRKFSPILAIIALFIIWEFAVRTWKINPIILPKPGDIFSTIYTQRLLLFVYAQTTILEILIGFATATLIGIPLGMLIYSSPAIKRAFYPLLVASQMVPKVAIAPLFVIWFGTDLMPKVLISFIIAFFPIMVSTVVGLESVESDMARMFRSMGASAFDTFMKLRLPAALPNIFAGLKIGMSLSVVGAIVGEFVAADRGLGYYLLFANGQMDTSGVFAALIVLTTIGVVLYFAIEIVQNLLIPPSLRKTPSADKATS